MKWGFHPCFKSHGLQFVHLVNISMNFDKLFLCFMLLLALEIDEIFEFLDIKVNS